MQLWRLPSTRNLRPSWDVDLRSKNADNQAKGGSMDTERQWEIQSKALSQQIEPSFLLKEHLNKG